MAFMGIFFISAIITIVFIAGSTFIGGILLIISSLMKRKQKKHFMVLRVIGIIFMIPIIAAVLYFVYSLVSLKIEKNYSLAYNVNSGNYERVEYLLKKGVSPDCSLESNNPAKNGEPTLLLSMCRCGGFFDEFEESVDGEITEEEFAMMQLLIDYGADINAVKYSHPKNEKRHRFVELTDYYNTDDQCGYTPLMYAVYRGDIKLVRFLVENGADVNAKDFCGFTPLLTAADNLNDDEGEEIILYLIENGARIDDYTNFNQTADFLAERNNLLENDRIEAILNR